MYTNNLSILFYKGYFPFSISVEKLFYSCGKVFLYIWKKENKGYLQKTIVIVAKKTCICVEANTGLFEFCLFYFFNLIRITPFVALAPYFATSDSSDSFSFVIDIDSIVLGSMSLILPSQSSPSTSTSGPLISL